MRCLISWVLAVCCLPQGQAFASEGSTYLALGDSYTIGQGVTAAERWPQQLVDLIRGHGGAISDPVYIARTGWTCDELALAIRQARPSGPFALITLQIGVNDQYRGRSADEFRQQLQALLVTIVALAEGKPARLVVLSIPDWGVSPFAQGCDRHAIATSIDAFNLVCAQEAHRIGARWVDITPLSRVVTGIAFTSDGLHPARAMYAQWAAATMASSDPLPQH